KRQALRQSQLALLRGQTRIEDGQLIRQLGQDPVDLPPEMVRRGDRDLSHPYYWSGFTMIGSPW
ncbi:MAG: CHAT domain-containing protein, partial [Leptolyngbyaceae cyanobacterium]